MLIDFIGNKPVLDQLEANISSGELSHGYLFIGSEGLGKFTAAKAFAARLLEPDRDDFIPRDNYENQNLRIIRSENLIKKEQIEDLVRDSKLKPYSGNYKIYIIDGFDKVTVSGQNAMLKMFEEPEDYLKIILISSSLENILPTVISRSRLIKFKDITDKEIENFLINREGLSRNNGALFARLATGSMKKAMRFAKDPSYLLLRDRSIEVLDRLLNMGGYPFRDMDFFKDSESLDDIFEFFIVFLRDLAFYKKGLEDEIINTDKVEFLKKQTISVKRAIGISEKILQTQRLLKENTNFDLAIEDLLIYIGGVV